MCDIRYYILGHMQLTIVRNLFEQVTKYFNRQIQHVLRAYHVIN